MKENMNSLRYTDPASSSEEFSIWFSGIRRAPGDWKSEMYTYARELASSTQRPLWVCFSGGIDSEVACRALYDQGIPFSILTLEHAQGTNLNDTSYARAWCKKFGVLQKIEKIDIDAFLTTDVDEYAKKYPAIHPFRFLQIRLMEIIESFGGYAVLCSGEQLYMTDYSLPIWTNKDVYISLSNGTTIPMQWCKDNNAEHEPYFHFGSPEMCLSYMDLPVVEFALNHPDSIFRHRNNKYLLKRLAYQSVWTDIDRRPKLDGFEQISPLFEACRTRLLTEYGSKHIEVRVSVEELRAQLTKGSTL